MDIARDDARRPDDEPPLHRPRGRRLKWAGFILLLLVVGLAAGYFTWSKKSEQRLADLIAGLQRAGEPVKAADLIHRPIPAEDDAAVDLFAAAALLDKQGAALEAYGRMELGRPLGTEERTTIEKLVEGERDVLEKIRGARGKRGADWRVQYQSPMLTVLLPHLNDLRQLANLSRAAAIRERLRRNDAAALEHLRDALAIGEATDTQPLLIGHLVALGVRALATHGLGEMAPDLKVRSPGVADGGQAGAATAEQVRATIAELLDEERSEKALLDGLRGERVMQLDTAKLLADRKLDLNAVAGVTPGQRRGMVPPVPRGMIMTDAVIMATHVGDLMKAYEKSPDFPAFRQNVPPMPAQLRQNPLLHPVANMLMPALDRFILQQYRSKVDRRLTAVALALRLYAAEHDGRYPQSLEELVPKYLPAVPMDPFASGDKPLGYSAADPAAPLIYSVGENGNDDGASQVTTRRFGGGAKPDRWQTLDAVLRMNPTPLVAPQVVPPEEGRGEGGAGDGG